MMMKTKPLESVRVGMALPLALVFIGTSLGEAAPEERVNESIAVEVESVASDGSRLAKTKVVLTTEKDNDFYGTVALNYGTVGSPKFHLVSIRTNYRSSPNHEPTISFDIEDASTGVEGRGDGPTVIRPLELFQVQSPFLGTGEYIIYEANQEMVVARITMLEAAVGAEEATGKGTEVRIAESRGTHPKPAIEEVENPKEGSVRHVLRIAMAGPPVSGYLDRVSVGFHASAQLWREVYHGGGWEFPRMGDLDGQGKPFNGIELNGDMYAATPMAGRSTSYYVDGDGKIVRSYIGGDSDKNAALEGGRDIEIELENQFDSETPSARMVATFGDLVCEARWDCKLVIGGKAVGESAKDDELNLGP